MNRTRSLLVGLAVWCGVVAVGATLVWVVIARAGAGVIPEATPQGAVTGSLPVPQPRSRTGSHSSPGVVLSPRATPSASSSPATSPASAPTSAPSATVTPPPTPAAQRRSWSGTAGHLVAECDGAAARLVAAYPNAGFRYQILGRGPREVWVRFLRLGDEQGITLSVHCVAGAPHFSTFGYEPGD